MEWFCYSYSPPFHLVHQLNQELQQGEDRLYGMTDISYISHQKGRIVNDTLDQQVVLLQN